MLLSESDELIILNNAIDNIFPKLKKEDKYLLNKYLTRLINIIVTTFDIDDYKNEFYGNNYRNCKWLLMYLLPFISTSVKPLSELLSLNEIYTNKVGVPDLQKEEPVYTWSNMQYGRCVRDKLQEIQFDESHIRDNYYLFVDTILSVSHKLYVNWVDIIPFTLNDLNSIVLKKEDFEQKSALDLKLKTRLQKLYENTNINVLSNKLKDLDFIENFSPERKDPPMKKLTNLYIGTIYEVMANYLYYAIIDYKFLIYDISAMVDNFRFPKLTPLPMILLLKNMFDLIELRNRDWDILTLKEQEKLEIDWKYYLQKANNQESINTTDLVIDSENLQRLMIILIISFEKKYKNLKKATEETPKYIPIKNLPNDSEEEEDLSIRKFSYERIEKNINSLQFKHMYTFLKDSIEGIQTTWYGLYFFNKTKTEIKDVHSFYIDFLKEKDITIKMVYNFCKSLIHYKNDKNEYVAYPRYWRSLDKTTRKIILDRLNEKTQVTEWFNINRYFEELIKAGALALDPKKDVRLTPFKLTPQNYKKEQSIELHKQTYDIIKKSLTGLIFECLITNGVFSTYCPCSVKESLNKQNNIWNSSYYFLTGTTYESMNKFLVKNKEGDIVESDFFEQTLKTYPWYTFDPFSLISQLGFVHKFINNRVVYITGATGAGKSSQVPKLYMYYLKSVDMNSRGAIVCTQPRIKPTDDTANGISKSMGVPMYNDVGEELDNYYVQMKYKGPSGTHTNNKTNNITLKIVTDGSLLSEMNNPVGKIIKRNRQTDKIEEIKERNLYDVIIIDESHEHNKNMDIILTLSKHALNLNNSLRLVIMSATLDADEPIYRRYYRDINDNRKFPLDVTIREHQIDRINVDRRFHFSPPDRSTRFVIKKIYLPDKDPNEIIIDLIKSTPKGNILLFQPGSVDIRTSIEFINKNTPSNVIAIPYISSLDTYHKNFVGDIDKTQKLLHINKLQDFETTDDLEKGVNNYDRIIVVATNIAEASITIDSLQYVVETGTQKTQIYDYKKKISSLKVTPIAESSKIQRTGRIGRTSDGTAYFTYEEGKLKNNKIQYKISIEDLTYDIYNFLRHDNYESRFFENDPNNPQAYFKFNQDDLNNPILSQYFINNTFYKYYGNEKMYDYENYISPSSYYQTGYPMRTLNDPSGTFYVIHPDELNFKRNLLGEIKILNNKDVEFIKKNIVKSKKLKSFWKILEDTYFLKREIIDNRENIIKTELGTLMIKILENISLSNKDTESLELKKSILFGWVHGIRDDMIKIVSCIGAISFDVSKLLLSVDNKPQINKLRSLYQGESDSEVLLKIFNDLEQYILKKNNIVDYSKNVSYYVDKFNSSLETSKISEYFQGKIDHSLDNDHVYDKLDHKLYENVDHIIDRVDLRQWAELRGLNDKVLYIIYKNYYKLKHNINKLLNKEQNKINRLLELIKNQYNLDIFKSNNLITKIMMLSYPYNICKKITDRKYRSVYNLELIFEMGSYKFKYIPRILINNLYIEDTILFLSVGKDNNEISLIHYIKGTKIYTLKN
jgi:hypothetical protein